MSVMVSSGVPIFWLPSQALTHTQVISGLISQPPFWRTPPQGPLRRVFGQFMGQAMPVSPSVHCPQDCESNKKPFTALSTAAKGLSSRSWPMAFNSGLKRARVPSSAE